MGCRRAQQTYGGEKSSMKKVIIGFVMAILMISLPSPRAFATGIPVVDVGAIANLIEQIVRLEKMIKELNTLTKYADLDHVNLSGKKFRNFLGQYNTLFSGVMSEITDYQNGGLMGQLDRLDEVYFSYYDGWEVPDLSEEANIADPHYRRLAKQVLWTRIQLKHAAKVGAKIRESLPQNQEQIATLLDDTAQAVGIMQSIKIGNQLTGTVSKGLQTLNVSLTEQLQAQAAEGLERNTKQGLKLNRARQAIKDWGKDTRSGPAASRNPFAGF